MQAYLAQLVERKTFNLVAVGSIPTSGTKPVYPSPVKGDGLKHRCVMLPGFESLCW